MCGIAGIIGPSSRDTALLRRMGISIAHRGPDDHGIWADSENPVAFVHRRLAIVDLSTAGHQPMVSADGRFTLCYNGEIYNHGAVRAELDRSGQIEWRGHSDTETLVEAIARWGIEETLDKLVGMFAFALWDARERTVRLVRDRFGEKPLYYGWVGTDFVFASELKAVRVHAGFDNSLNRPAIHALCARGYIPAPMSIHEGIFKLPPGHVLTATRHANEHPCRAAPTATAPGSGVMVERYWSYRDQIVEGLRDPIEDEAEALEGLEAVLRQSIGGQSVADVSVGSFLSGGIDSSTVTALYQAIAPGRVRSFTLGFAEAGFDEADFARRVAAHLGTEHTEHYVDADEALAVIPDLPTIYDEPFADSSQIPTFLVSKLARQHVKVALSGDGGDELFGGYNRYLTVARLWRHARRLPAPVRTAVGSVAATIPSTAWQGLIDLASRSERAPHLGSRVQGMFASLAGARDLDGLMAGFLDQWSGIGNPVANCDSSFGADPLPPHVSVEQQLMATDALSYLPDDILCKVDRAAMAVSLETRVPFLDHRVSAFAARLPLAMKIRGGEGKSILRKLVARHLPSELFDRPKAGFAIPVGQWLRGPLKPWAEDLISPDSLRRSGHFDEKRVARAWALHQSGRRDLTPALWSVLMFQGWLGEQAR